MRFEIKVYPRSSREQIEQSNDRWKIYVRESATDGKANEAVQRLLSHHFNVSKTSVKIVRGEKSRIKLVAISEF